MGKFVGALVVLSVLAMPAAALASCWAPPAMSAGCPMCPAAQHQSAPASVQEAPAGSSCCDLSSSKPAPASELQVPATTTLLTPPAQDIVMPAVAPSRRADISSQQPASPPDSFQAVLCTFLI